MTNFIINKHNHYFMLTSEVSKLLDTSKLQDCETFDNMESFYNAVHKRFPDISDINELMGSYIELWYDDETNWIIGDHICIDHINFDVQDFAETLSEFKAVD